MSDEITESRRRVPKSLREREDALIAKAIRILEARLMSRIESPTELKRPKDVADYLKLKLAEREREVFACIFLDAKQRVLAFEELFSGTIDQATVYPREVVRRALAHNAARVICAHNHVSGVPEPSVADKVLTRSIGEALDLMGIKLLDHFIIGCGEPYSFAANGLI